jgi:hypothetical protein
MIVVLRFQAAEEVGCVSGEVYSLIIIHDVSAEHGDEDEDDEDSDEEDNGNADDGISDIDVQLMNSLA